MNLEFWRKHVAVRPYYNPLDDTWCDADNPDNDFIHHNIAHEPKVARRLIREYTKVVKAMADDELTTRRHMSSFFQISYDPDRDIATQEMALKARECSSFWDYELTGNHGQDILNLWQLYWDAFVKNARSYIGIRSTTTGNPNAPMRQKVFKVPDVFMPYVPALVGKESLKKRATKIRNNYLSGIHCKNDSCYKELLEHLRNRGKIHAPWHSAYFWCGVEYCDFTQLTETLLGRQTVAESKRRSYRVYRSRMGY